MLYWYLPIKKKKTKSVLSNTMLRKWHECVCVCVWKSKEGVESQEEKN